MADENARAGGEWDWLEDSALRLGGALVTLAADRWEP
jgi:hypothetical protein